MRTTQDILNRLKEIKEDDFFGFQSSDLLEFLPFEDAKTFLKPDTDGSKWQQKEPSKENALTEILNYMPFAWDKANNRRGLSAARSIEHMKAWLWLAEDDLYYKLNDMYRFYGKPCLAVICEKYNWDWRQWDDNLWTNNESDIGSDAPDKIEIPA